MGYRLVKEASLFKPPETTCNKVDSCLLAENMIYQFTTCWRIEFAFSKESRDMTEFTNIQGIYTVSQGKCGCLKTGVVIIPFLLYIYRCMRATFIVYLDSYLLSETLGADPSTFSWQINRPATAWASCDMRCCWRSRSKVASASLKCSWPATSSAYLSIWVNPIMIHQTELRWFLGENPCIQWFLKFYWNQWFH